MRLDLLSSFDGSTGVCSTGSLATGTSAFGGCCSINCCSGWKMLGSLMSTYGLGMSGGA